MKRFAACAVVFGLVAFVSLGEAGPLVNPGFETGDFTGWTDGPPPYEPPGRLPRSVQDDVRHEGTYAALLGEVKLPELTQPGSAWIMQEVSVPTGAGQYLSFWYRFKTYDKIQDAFFQVQLRNSEGVVQLLTRGWTGAVSPTWGEVYEGHPSFNLSAYGGQTIQLWFETVQADLGQGAWAFVDDVRVE